MSGPERGCALEDFVEGLDALPLDRELEQLLDSHQPTGGRDDVPGLLAGRALPEVDAFAAGDSCLLQGPRFAGIPA
jgi:hypothetical protein